MYVQHQRSKLRRLMEKLENVQKEELLISSKIQEMVRNSPFELEPYYKHLLSEKHKNIHAQRINN